MCIATNTETLPPVHQEVLPLGPYNSVKSKSRETKIGSVTTVFKGKPHTIFQFNSQLGTKIHVLKRHTQCYPKLFLRNNCILTNVQSIFHTFTLTQTSKKYKKPLHF
jgi:hypothetical protein